MKEHFHTLYFRDFCQFESWKKRPFAETVSGCSHNLVCAHFALARQKALSETLRSHQREVGANEVARFFRPSELSRLRIFLSTRGLTETRSTPVCAPKPLPKPRDPLPPNTAERASPQAPPRSG